MDDRILRRHVLEESEFDPRVDATRIVMGAYGHTRLREWVFGGATRDILQAMPICCLMSH